MIIQNGGEYETKAEDLTGRRFGKWVVIGRAPDKISNDKKRANGKPIAMWFCRCDCGTERAVEGKNLRSGGSSGCGMCCGSPANYDDLTGRRFGKLLVVCRDRSRSAGEPKWNCLCDCGRTVFVLSSNLKRGNSKSCGCIRDEMRKRATEEANERKRQKDVEQKQERLHRRELKFAARFDLAYGDCFEYLGGYPDYSIIVRCKNCGYVRNRKKAGIFTECNISCPECGNNRKVVDNRKGVAESMCVVCGAAFEQYSPQQTMCSDCHKDMERAKRSTQKRLREARARHNGKVDYTITLSRLMERDGNVCALCGREVNENDYVYVGDSFIAGNDYPSIDHIKPLSKGGLHQWGNVQLAHRLCNSLKCDKE